MSDTVITVENLSKKYIIGHEQEGGYKTLRDVMAGAAQRAGKRLLHPFNGSAASPNGHKEEFWALKDVSFEIKQGEVVGIIGRNGAGKSTLLKILSRITEPTTGRVRIKGRIASLLEVGTGFHPELTGRENIFLNGAILGMTKEEIKRKFDEIVAFAEIERFLDTPVKRYSSGMYVRLAFAVAAHLEPEILLVDEVLAVGDVVFQNKCLGKMDKVAQQGRTVFYVSHNMASIKRLCSTAMWFSQGQIITKDHPHTIISEYLQDNLVNRAVVEITEQAHLVRSALQIQSVEVLNSRLQPSGELFWDEDISLRLAVMASEPVAQAQIGIGIHSEGIRISTVHSLPIDFPASTKPRYLICRIPGNTLLPNFYSVHVGAQTSEIGRALDWVADVVSFRIEPLIHDGTAEYDQKNFGLLNLNVKWAGDVFEPKELMSTHAD